MSRSGLDIIRATWLILAALAASSARSAVVGEDDRRPLDEFAARHNDPENFKRRLSGTQELRCLNGSRSSATLVERADIVVVAAHTLFRVHGQEAYDLRTCFVYVARDHGEDRHEIDPDSLVLGRFGALGRTQFDPEDWAVVRLKQPIAGIRPYRLLKDYVGSAVLGQPVVLVTGPQQDKRDDKKPLRLAHRCRLLVQFATRTEIEWFKTDCDARLGSSGGSLLLNVEEDPPTFVGLQVYSSPRDGSCADYHRERCSSIAVGPRLRLVEAVRRLAQAAPRPIGPAPR